MTARMRPVVLLGVLPVGLLAAVLMAGCSSGPRAPYRATTSTCYAFSVQALDRHITVTSVPRACARLSHEQINLAVARAVRAVVGPRPKVAGRRLAHRELAYLKYLIKAAPVPAPAPVAAAGRLGVTPWIAAAASSPPAPSANSSRRAGSRLPRASSSIPTRSKTMW